MIQKHEKSLKKDNSAFEIVGYIKLLLVILLGVTIYFLFAKNFSLQFLAVGVLELAGLIAFWVYQNKLREQINYSNGIISINKRHLDRISGKWSDFKDIGSEFVDTEHDYACDLDIVGQKSLFQFLNTTHTWYGRKAFASDLLNYQYSPHEVKDRQKGITELSEDINFMSHMEYYFSKFASDDSTKQLVDGLMDKRVFIKSKVLKCILIYVPMLTFILIAAVVIFKIENLYLASIFIIFAQMMLWVFGMSKTQGYLRTFYSLPYKLGAYSDAIDTLKDKKFSSDKLKDIQNRLGTSDVSATQAIRELEKISARVSVRNNAIVYFLLNMILLWDFECAILYEKWKLKYASAAEDWFIAIGEFESMMSFALIPNICNNTCLPRIVTGNNISAEDLGHPMIQNNNRVDNDISCNNNIFIISGSNMSGKTTFLRTVGINLVLAGSGSFVCAKCMEFPLVRIITSMRIADDLNEGISTFYAELKRIKSILEFAKKESNMFFLIDEMFRGTNSCDRLIGAKTILSKLNELGVIGIITTHDLDLCDLESHFIRTKNYNFSEYYYNNQIYFDYKIKQGKSNTTNAKYLMEMVGIL